MDTPTPTVLLVSLVQAQAASPRGLCCFRSHFARRAPVAPVRLLLRLSVRPSPSEHAFLGFCMRNNSFGSLLGASCSGLPSFAGALVSLLARNGKKQPNSEIIPSFGQTFRAKAKRGLACNLVLCAASVFGVTSARVRHDSGLPNSMLFCHRRPRRMTGIAFGEGK